MMMFNLVDRTPWVVLLQDRFGFPDAVFAPYTFIQPNAKYIAIVPNDFDPPARPPAVQLGMPLIKLKMRYPKLSTQGVMLLGAHATRNVVDLDAARADAYRTRQPLHLDADVLARCTGQGYVIVRTGGRPLGMAVFLPDDLGEGGELRSMFPRHWAGLHHDASK